MHPSFSTRGAQRRHFVNHRPRTGGPTCVVQLTVEADALLALRELVVRFGGAAFEYLRVAPCHQAAKIKVWICLRPSGLEMVTQALQRRWPGIEFGLDRHQASKMPQ